MAVLIFIVLYATQVGIFNGGVATYGSPWYPHKH